MCGRHGIGPYTKSKWTYSQTPGLLCVLSITYIVFFKKEKRSFASRLCNFWNPTWLLNYASLRPTFSTYYTPMTKPSPERNLSYFSQIKDVRRQLPARNLSGGLHCLCRVSTRNHCRI